MVRALPIVADAVEAGDPVPLAVDAAEIELLRDRLGAASRAEMRDLAAADDPLAGREWPAPAGGAAPGPWLANQLCDLVQVRSTGAGAVVCIRVGR